MKTRPTPILALAALLFAGAQTAALAERFTDRSETTYRLGPDAEISLGNSNGNVSVEAWDEDFVQLVAEKRVEASNAAAAAEAFAAIEVIIDEDAGRLEVETRLPGATSGLWSWLSGRSHNGSVSYELRVPRSTDLDLQTANGNVSTKGATGRLRLHSTNGRIDVEGAGEDVEADTVNGSIRVAIGGASSQADITLDSTNGGITLYLPAAIAGRLEARTVNGSIKTELPVTIGGGSSRRRLSGDINGGGASRIELSTTNGSIRISDAAER
jgi:hypothetical protein